MTSYRSGVSASADDSGAVGILVAHLGTPDAPTAPALRRYLRQFLSDPRVIELPRWKWLPILHLFVLTTRPKKSAALYQKIWTPEGSPLLVLTRKLAAAIGDALRARVAEPLHVAVGMRYGNPSMASALHELAERGCRPHPRLPALPAVLGHDDRLDLRRPLRRAAHLAPHARAAHHRRLPRRPRLRARAGGEHPRQLASSAAGRRSSSSPSTASRAATSTAATPTTRTACETARLVAAELGIGERDYQVTFQSLFGKEEWLRPYTDETMKRLGSERLPSVDVVCPGFSVDCLETLEEIDGLNREFFTHAGGGDYRYVPCLNDRPDHVAALADVALRHLGGWVTPVLGGERRAGERAAADARCALTTGRRRRRRRDAGSMRW